MFSYSKTKKTLRVGFNSALFIRFVYSCSSVPSYEVLPLYSGIAFVKQKSEPADLVAACFE